MSGWFNSYNYQQFSNEEIEEYIDNTVRKLSCYMNTNSRVLEVGVGSGMFVERMAELCARYDGCDISSVVIDKLQEELDSKNIGNVNLYNCSADEIDKLESEYDIIFMNSVTEYFSGYNYLRKVVEKCIEKIDKKGVIMFADVFDLAKKESYCNDIIRYSHGHPDCRNKKDFSHELFIPHEFWKDMANSLHGIKKVSISDKLGILRNEINMFRYDVIFEIDKDIVAKSNKQSLFKIQMCLDQVFCG